MQNWLTMTAAELGRGIEAGEIDPVDLTETYLAAIASHEFSDRIYVRLTEDRARAEAEAASLRAKSGQRLSPLDGVPISWKDLYDTAGVATESGSKLLEGRVPDQDALVLQNAAKAGLICLGKTHQTELAFSGLGLNPITASPPCVNDYEAVSGGSSSGAGTSVAFGLAAAGIGSDTGGSVRIPAVWNDLVGLKTVSGRMSLDGVVPLCESFDTVGPLCRSVEDAALLMQAMEGSDLKTPAPVSLDGLHLGVLTTCAFDGIEGAAMAGFNSAVERLQNAGAKTTRFACEEVEEATGIAPTLFPAEAYGTWRHRIDVDGDLMYPPVRTRFIQGKSIMAADYVAGWRRLKELRRAFAAAIRDYDAVIWPTCAILPPKQAEVLADEEWFTKKNLVALQNTRIVNLMGLAALTLPTGLPSTGIMFVGPSEEKLLEMGMAAETALS